MPIDCCCAFHFWRRFWNQTCTQRGVMPRRCASCTRMTCGARQRRARQQVGEQAMVVLRQGEDRHPGRALGEDAWGMEQAAVRAAPGVAADPARRPAPAQTPAATRSSGASASACSARPPLTSAALQSLTLHQSPASRTAQAPLLQTLIQLRAPPGPPPRLPGLARRPVASRPSPRSARLPPHPRPPPARKGRCLLYTSPSPRDRTRSRMPSSA